MNPNYPIYIVSKGRADTRKTSRELERMNVPYHIVVEDQEFDEYAAVIDEKKIIVADRKYHAAYDTFDDLGDSKSKGPGWARNFIWDHSIEAGYDWHWVMDDNIRKFFKFNNNTYIRVKNGAIFKYMEDFCQRYKNVAMGGPQYFMFVPRKTKLAPFIKNTRIYSCNLIRNSVPYRWRGRYNEDTDLSLRMLKDSWCTIQFNAYLQEKCTTQTMKGGNSKEFYDKEGTKAKSEMLRRMHFDVARECTRFSRDHHHVNYAIFKKTQLVREKLNGQAR